MLSALQTGEYEAIATSGQTALMDTCYADGPLLAWLEYERHVHALVRLLEDRQLHQDLAGLLRGGLIASRTHTDVLYSVEESHPAAE